MRTFWIVIVVAFVAMGAFVFRPWTWLGGGVGGGGAAGGGAGPATPREAVASKPAAVERSVGPGVGGAGKGGAGGEALASRGAGEEAIDALAREASAPRAGGGAGGGAGAGGGHQPGHVPVNAPPAPPPGTPTVDTFEVVPSTREVQADGSVLFDGAFAIRGTGTAESPYEISWDLLTSVEKHYDPSTGKRQIPERVAMLAGKHVRITGYVAFPLLVQQPRELLVMLNQWDGCCIGVPPTPYDAIEVRLRGMVVGDDRFATYGTLSGRLGVEPYVVGNWLIGLYVLDDASLSATEFGGVGF